ncbi:unnamed protein product, partial [Laminaria digitata]
MPELDVTPESIDFVDLSTNPNRPSSFVGQVISTRVVVKNTGRAPAELMPVRVQGGAAAEFETSVDQVGPIAAGQSSELVISYAPQSPGVHKAQLTIGAGLEALQVTLHGLAEDCPAGPQALGRADPDGTCRLVCNEGFGDADLDATNGCECTISDPTDAPDPQFQDTNCDGIDGDRLRAVFVALPPVGDDANAGGAAAPVA